METEEGKHPQRFIINEYTVKNVINKNELIPNFKNVVYNENLWHKISIHGGARFKIDDILTSILNLTSPYELIAVDIKVVHKTDIEFLCNSCGLAIEVLCKTKNIALKHFNCMLQMTLTIGYKDVNIYKSNVKNELLKLLFSLNNRYDSETCALDLSYFNSIKGVKHLIYCDFKNTNSIIYILSLLEQFEINILDLTGNYIETIDEKFATHPTTKNIKSIDLKHNKIRTLKDVGPLKLMNITEITLTDNPICGCYENAADYLFAVKTLMPSLQVLDGIQVDTLLTALPRVPYYVTSKSAEYLIDQFLEHYFTVYDNTSARSCLHHLYHPRAMFSMSSLIVAFDIESEFGLQKYDSLAHNLLKWNKSDYDIGPESILKKLCYLPKVKHDPHSFCIDVLNYTEGVSVIFVINGSFREPKKEHIMYNFTRTFALVADEDGAYNITNDMLYVTNAEPKSIRAAFCQNHLGDDLKISLKSASTEHEKSQFVDSFSELTSMHEDYAKEYLNVCNWNFTEALEKFVHNVQFNLIPKTYFSRGFNDNDAVEILKNGPLNIRNLDEAGLQRVLSHFNITMKNRCDFCPLKPKWCSHQQWKRIRHDLLKLAKHYKLPLP